MELLNFLGGLVWGPLGITLLVGTGILMTILLKAIQFRKITSAFKLLSKKHDMPEEEGEISHFQALSAALSATIGTGNIAGVGTAIALGGPGAVFWMWITALFGMALKYSEALLSLNFRQINEDGSVSAGPMYYIEKGLGQKWLAMLFAFFAAIASFGIGNMVQVNSVAEPALSSFGIPKIVTGIVLGLLTFFVIIGGIKRIGQVASRLVPFMALFYVISALIILILNIEKLGMALGLIVEHAMSPSSALGGFTGATVAQALRFGVARGVFSNESGLGSAPIAHGAARTKEPVKQGLIAMIGPFIDTIIICTMTALVIIVTDAYTLTDAAGKGLTGSVLTSTAFNNGLNMGDMGQYIVALGIIFFAFSTIITWSYYGDRSIEYLLGSKFVVPYRVLFCLLVPIGAAVKLDIVWSFSDVANGLMAWPNLIGIIFLSPVIMKMTKDYFREN